MEHFWAKNVLVGRRRQSILFENRFADLWCNIPNHRDHKPYRRKLVVKLAQKQNYNGRELWILASIVSLKTSDNNYNDHSSWLSPMILPNEFTIMMIFKL